MLGIFVTQRLIEIPNAEGVQRMAAYNVKRFFFLAPDQTSSQLAVTKEDKCRCFLKDFFNETLWRGEIFGSFFLLAKFDSLCLSVFLLLFFFFFPSPCAQPRSDRKRIEVWGVRWGWRGAAGGRISTARYDLLAIHKTLTAEHPAGFTIHCKYAADPIHGRRRDSAQYIRRMWRFNKGRCVFCGSVCSSCVCVCVGVWGSVHVSKGHELWL